MILDENGMSAYPFTDGELAALVRLGVLPPESVSKDTSRGDLRMSVSQFTAATSGDCEVLPLRPMLELFEGRVVTAPQWGFGFNFAGSEIEPLMWRVYNKNAWIYTRPIPLQCDEWTALTPALTVFPRYLGRARPVQASSALFGLVIDYGDNKTTLLIQKMAIGGLPSCWRIDPREGVLEVLSDPSPHGYQQSCLADPRGVIRPVGADGDVPVSSMFLPRTKERILDH